MIGDPEDTTYWDSDSDAKSDELEEAAMNDHEPEYDIDIEPADKPSKDLRTIDDKLLELVLKYKMSDFMQGERGKNTDWGNDIDDRIKAYKQVFIAAGYHDIDYFLGIVDKERSGTTWATDDWWKGRESLRQEIRNTLKGGK